MLARVQMALQVDQDAVFSGAYDMISQKAEAER